MVKFYFRVICITLFIISTQNIFSQNENGSSPRSTQKSTESNASQINKDQTIATDESQLILEPNTNKEINIKPFGIWNTIKVFLVLLLLLIFGAFILLFFKRLQNPRLFHNSEVLDIVSSKGLSQGNTLYLLKIARGFILIAQSSQAIHIIKEYNEKDDIDEINVALSEAEAKSESEKEKMTFYQKLQKKLSLTNVGLVNPHINHYQSQEIHNSFNNAISNNSLLDFFRSKKRNK